MDEIEKLLRKVKQSDRERLLEVLEQLHAGDLRGLNIKKLSGTDFFRARVGRYRIIFSIDTKKSEIQVKSIRSRNEETYK